MQDSLICLARDRGIILVPIDISLPLTEQGPFDFIVQKIYGDEWKSRIKEYSQKYPDVPIIDPPEMVEKLRDRISMLDVVNQIDVSQEKETFGIPKQVVVYDQKGLSDDISDALNILSFPIIAKPLAASGTDASHKMELVFHRDGLLKLKPPIVLQEFVNHGGVIFKVYVAGDHVNCVKRKSLPDISEEKLKRCEGSVQFSLISNMSMKDHKAEEGKYYEKMHLEDAVMPPISFVTDIARGLRRAMGLNLFNFDVIRDAKIGNHYVVVDINYFPGYAKMPSYETVLTDFFCDIVRKYTKQDGKLDSVVH